MLQIGCFLDMIANYLNYFRRTVIFFPYELDIERGIRSSNMKSRGTESSAQVYADTIRNKRLIIFNNFGFIRVCRQNELE